MAKKFPIDEFDKLPPHGGRHRIRRNASVRVREFFGYMLAAAVIAFGWLLLPCSTVVDATGEDGVAGTLAHRLLNKNWKVVAADNAANEADKTTVYINASTLTPAAEELLKALGKYPISVSADYSDPITVLIGKDFK